MSVFYGGSGNGKSSLIVDCLYKLKDIIPVILIVSPTESQNQTYRDIVPAECIIDDTISSEKLLQKLNDIYQR